jgi:hypothetical protein
MTVAGLLVAIALLAFDLAAVARLRGGLPWHPFQHKLVLGWELRLVLAVLPLGHALVIGLYLLMRQLKRHGEGAAFLVGFQAVGWLVVAVESVARSCLDEEVWNYESWIVARLWDFWSEYIMWGGGFTTAHEMELASGFHVIAMAAPPLLLALCGGWAAAALGVRVVRQPAPMRGLRVVPARRAVVAFVVTAMLLFVLVWAAQVHSRWLRYRALADGYVQAETMERGRYEWALQRIKWLDDNPGTTRLDRAHRAHDREMCINSAEQSRREIDRMAARRRVYEPAAQRPWLPIPPNPPLDPSKLKTTR